MIEFSWIIKRFVQVFEYIIGQRGKLSEKIQTEETECPN